LATTIAKELGIPYLLNATESQAKEVVEVGHGYIYGSKFRPVVPFVVGHKGEVVGFFSSWIAVPRCVSFGSGECQCDARTCRREEAQPAN
jgi:hypothetical protein